MNSPSRLCEGSSQNPFLLISLPILGGQLDSNATCLCLALDVHGDISWSSLSDANSGNAKFRIIHMYFCVADTDRAGSLSTSFAMPYWYH